MLFELLESVGLQDTLRALREELERKKQEQQLKKGKEEEQYQYTEHETDKPEEKEVNTSSDVIERLEAKLNEVLSNVEGDESIKTKSYNRNNNNLDNDNDESDNYTEALTENKSLNDVNEQPNNLTRTNGERQYKDEST